MVKQHVSFGATTTAMQMYIDKKKLEFQAKFNQKGKLKNQKNLAKIYY
jgi:hypothetical protein